MSSIIGKAKNNFKNVGAKLYSKSMSLINGDKGDGVNWVVVTLVAIILIVVVFVLFKDTLIPLIFGKISSKVNEIS
ncbi:hypothetical protein [Paenibacillus odorifer]|uniref:hypothetical protein n=1 Tax=Paenibacillus odorifer TaxID=189426 RepID=UPI00096F9384|nr:hypothetical protein [Paenibacillus odorifer]OMD10627.1 hypothetical protein BJP50_28340 [Paenibacillus odorifer]